MTKPLSSLQMASLPADEIFLAQALELAREAAAFASPNPTVGCVIERDGVVLGEGAHRYAAFDHAEIVALKQAADHGHNVRGATAYVTLEPCSHHGRTGPCAEALVRVGIARCVVATTDPNPQVSGSGIARMQAAGIDVRVLDESSPLASQARKLNDAFAFSVRHARPFVTLKAAVSLDGMLAPPPSTRTTQAPFWLTGAAARADVQLLRHASDAVLTGIGTVLADDPLLTDRSGQPRGRKLLRTVLDSRLRTPLTSRLVQTADDDLLVAIGAAQPVPDKHAYQQAGAEVVRIDSPHSNGPSPAAEWHTAQADTTQAAGLDLAAVLQALNARGVRSLLLECGSQLNASWLRAGLVDRVVLYIADIELGPSAVPFAAGWGSPYTLQQKLTHQRRTTFSRNDTSTHEDVRIDGYLHEPWPKNRK